MATITRVKMRSVSVLAVLAAVLLVVHADFYVNLFYEPTEKYLSAINFGGTGGVSYLQAAKSNPDGFTKFNFVTTGLSDGQVAIQPFFAPSKYFCRDYSDNLIREVEGDITSNCIYRYRVSLDSDDMCKYSITLRADNGRFLVVDGTSIVAEGRRPVHYDVLEPTD